MGTSHTLWLTFITASLVVLTCPSVSFARKTVDNATVKQITYVSDHRLLNWCVTGNDEPEFFYYPYSDFVPYFKKTGRDMVRRNDQNKKPKYDYHFEIRNPRYRDASALKGDLVNTGHFKFTAFVLRESALGIKEILNRKKIEGLAIQINWAPSGIGLPANFAFVDQDEDIVCFDCKAKYGVPVGCRRRPANAIIHPTILLYHHKMKISDARVDRLQALEAREKFDKDEAMRLQQVYQAQLKTYLASLPSSTPGGANSSTTAPTPAPPPAGRRKRQSPTQSPQANPPPPQANPSTAAQTNSSTPAPLNACDIDPNSQACFDLYDYLNAGGAGSFMGPADEIHGTLHWFLPPCSTTRGIEFQVLVIHNFAQQEYEVFKVGPYEIPPMGPSTIKAKKHNPYIPSPFFHGFTELNECDSDQNSVVLTMNDYSAKFRHPFDYSHSYELCLLDVDDYTPDDDKPQVCPRPSATKCDASTSQFLDKVHTKCSQVQCDSTRTTTLRPSTGAGKRGVHGGINMVTNFCLQPIFIFIGRYYKETFNIYEFKGAKMWFWIHMLGGGFASICQYIGYFHPKYVDRSSHVYAGNTLMILLAITYVSAWIRHKGKWGTFFAELIHGLAGYIVSGLAFWCLHTAPGVSNAALACVYAATIILLIGYIIMECCICMLDHKFGMHPRRRHFPTIEARFDDIPVPKRGLRIALLIVISILMLILTIVSAFV